MKTCRRLLGLFLVVCGFIVAAEPALSNVQLPRLISDGMVLQRNADSNIWGWAEPKEKLTIRFMGEMYETTADGQGEWYVQLPR